MKKNDVLLIVFNFLDGVCVNSELSDHDLFKTIHFSKNSKNKLNDILKNLNEEKNSDIDILFWSDFPKEEVDQIILNIENSKNLDPSNSITFTRVGENNHLEEIKQLSSQELICV